MLADVRWIALLCLMINVSCRVVDDPGMDIVSPFNEEDPYDEEPFEEDRYEAPQTPRGAPQEEEEEEGYEQRYPREEPQARASSKDEEDSREEERPFRECTGPQDCMQDECCHIGMERYSIPSCRRQGNEGDYCRVGGEPVNVTLFYPNGEHKDVTYGHVLFCPCSQGLACLRAVCRPSRELFLQDGGYENTL